MGDWSTCAPCPPNLSANCQKTFGVIMQILMLIPHVPRLAHYVYTKPVAGFQRRTT